MRLLKAVEILIPPDKSISHRAVMLAAISKGTTRIKNLLMADDIKRTIEAFRAMGVKIDVAAASYAAALAPQGGAATALAPQGGAATALAAQGAAATIYGVGMRGLKKPAKPLYLGNSGTTMRILPGVLAGQDFDVTLTGDKSLSGRPMKRIIEPLKKMGARISGYPPLKIHGGKLKAIKYNSKITSAQVKSCILLAGLYADGITSVTEPVQSRDHTERMLKMFGCRVSDETLKGKFHQAGTQPLGCKVSINGPVKLKSPGVIEIPGDISSAAFFIAAGCILPDTKVIIKNVGLNPTRIGIIDILKKMGAAVTLQHRALSLEPRGDIIATSSRLRGVTISPRQVVSAIDEIPIIMVAACFAKGKTVIKGIEELRVKETDRVHSMVTDLRKIGADIKVEVKGECIIINGDKLLHGARVSSFGDHRTAMSMLVAGLRTKGRVIVTGLGCINKSFPNFISLLRILNQP